MLISVISLNRGVGVTTTAMLLAMGIGAMKKRALLVHTASKTNIYMDYFGLQDLGDKTTSPNLLVKLLRDGAIQPDGVADYCRQVSTNAYIFTNTSDLVSNDDMFELSQFFIHGSDFDYVLYDMDDWGNPTAKYVLENADLVVICIPQSLAHLKDLKVRLKRFRKLFMNKSILLVCDRYDSAVGSYKDLGKALGFKSDCFVIHQNSWVGWSQNRGMFHKFFAESMSKSPEMLEVGNDVQKLVTGVFRIKTKAAQAVQDAKRAALAKEKRGSKGASEEEAENSATGGSQAASGASDVSQGSGGAEKGNTGDSGVKAKDFDRTWYRP